LTKILLIFYHQYLRILTQVHTWTSTSVWTRSCTISIRATSPSCVPTW